MTARVPSGVGSRGAKPVPPVVTMRPSNPFGHHPQGDGDGVGPVLGHPVDHHLEPGAEVTVAYGADALELVVTNPLAGAAPSPGGHGLLGMRERVAVLGGRLEAGPGGRPLRGPRAPALRGPPA